MSPTICIANNFSYEYSSFRKDKCVIFSCTFLSSFYLFNRWHFYTGQKKDRTMISLSRKLKSKLLKTDKICQKITAYRRGWIPRCLVHKKTQCVHHHKEAWVIWKKLNIIQCAEEMYSFIGKIIIFFLLNEYNNYYKYLN